MSHDLLPSSYHMHFPVLNPYLTNLTPRRLQRVRATQSGNSCRGP
jgi:hypothetical protein